MAGWLFEQGHLTGAGNTALPYMYMDARPAGGPETAPLELYQGRTKVAKKPVQ
jgi:hypothetical protein